jgi:hypothetical protein
MGILTSKSHEEPLLANPLISNDPWGNLELPLCVPDVHAYGLERSAALSEYYVPNYIKPLDLVAALAREGVRSVLVGSHGMGGWRQGPRAAQDTVLIVAARNHRKAIQTLLSGYPNLTVEDNESGTTLRAPDPKGVVIEVLNPARPLLRKALVKTRTIHVDGRLCLIPTLEIALDLVFDPMTQLPWSSPEKYLNAGDFIRMIQANPRIDFKELEVLGELINKGAGTAIVDKVKRVQAGEKLDF